MGFQLSNYFFKARPEDKKIIENIVHAFQHTNRMQSLVTKTGDDYIHSVQVIVAYIYFLVKKTGGVFISKNKSTFLLYYQKSEHYSSFRDHVRYLYMTLMVIGIQKLRKNFRREKKNKLIRSLEIKKNGNQDYLYVCLLAQIEDEKRIDGLLEVKNHIIQKSITLNLPIYMETTESRLVPLYERIGFVFYHSRKDVETGLTFWFGKYLKTD